MKSKSESGSENPLLEEAADWMFLLKDSPSDQKLTARHQAWLEEDPAHRTAWSRTCTAWQALGELTPETRSPDTETDAPGRAPGHSRRLPPENMSRPRFITGGRVAALAGIAAAACLLLLIAPTWLMQLDADHYTRTGEIRTVSLPDGSRVTLAGASAIKLRMSEDRRGVELLGGEAFFDIAHNPDRPFQVDVSDLRVTVLGTRFNLRRGVRTADVSLLEGSVEASPAGQPQESVRLHPGQRLRLANADGSSELLDVQPEDIAAWRHQRLVVTDQTVSSVAEQIGRYKRGWISIPDRDLASQRVTGVYDLSDPGRALGTLVAPFGGQAYEISDYLHILTRLD